TANDESQRMPPEGEPLSQNEIQVIRQWILQGAMLDGSFVRGKSDLWSFQPIQASKPMLRAKGHHSLRVQNPVDFFVSRKLEKLNLTLGQHEKQNRIIRRLFLVTLGVLPTEQQVQEFVTDPRPDAYDRLLERVLSSPEYGERWAQHWLDIIRFGETQGFETNRERPNAWPFRDYVIESLNSDKPYNEFVREQIAGDQLGEPVGTGYIVAGAHDIVGSPDINLTMMQRQDELADIVNVTGTTFLGLTIGCARCHDHKFDPISQKDFYSIQAVFAGIKHAERSLPPANDSRRRLEQLESEIAALQAKLVGFIPPDRFSSVVIDESQTDRLSVRYLVPPAGKKTNPVGTGRGERDDPGSSKRSANRSGGSYRWWVNRPGQDLAIYSPGQTGLYRVWLSWGCGSQTYSRDAVYELDLDGRLETRGDRKLLATIDQTRFADGAGKLANPSLWSGFKDAGVHRLTPEAVIVLRGGKTGTEITTDTVVLQPQPRALGDVPGQPHVRPAVSPKHNVDLFPEIEAKRVRFTILASNNSQPCIDELEVFSSGRNVALASTGARASSSGDFKHPLHKLPHVNDGEYGNPKSWIAEKNQGWVQIEFPAVQKIDRVEWARDRLGVFGDRLATEYRVEVSVTPGEWILVASSADRHRFEPGAPAKQLPDYEFSGHPLRQAQQGRDWASRLNSLKAEKSRLSRPIKVYAGTFVQPGPTFRLYRGDPLQKREQVGPDTIQALGELNLQKDVAEKDRRITFANWLVAKENPLLARVIVNRIWQHVFGQGIVATPNDFGNSGRSPTHPELLDWLARELVDSDWSLKQVHRLILASQTFRQSSRPDPSALAIDAGCQYLWRFPPRRLEAEGIRDSILTASGVLDRQVGGKGFNGFEIQMENVRHFFPKKSYGPADWRRMIYMTKVRQERDSVFGAFDCPDASQIIDRRSRSTTPLQSLNLLNSKFVLQQARLMAVRLEQQSRLRRLSPVVIAYQVAYCRSASPNEIKASQVFIAEFGLPAFCRALLNSNEFLFIQ
ncbi:MAG: DUF1553 domain-containing protein, partial [Planctomycetota bacterium]|nr:DUF1553 domain-containing protein [Planctomycetota bacterium]